MSEEVHVCNKPSERNGMTNETLKTSRVWWEDVLSDEAKLIEWLQSQHYGEVTAADRILAFSNQFCHDEHHTRTLGVIAQQERMHAAWVRGLLTSRGVSPHTPEKAGRYWDVTLPGIKDFETGSAVASHAERMRLLRIRVIVEHPLTPLDIRDVFAKILPEEIFHERAFAKMAGEEALRDTEGAHDLGMKALGLTM